MRESKTIESLLDATCEEGNRRIQRNKVTYSSRSDVNEKFVVQVMRDVSGSVGVDRSSVVHFGGRAFPDVHIDGTHVGIELKGSQSGGSLVGNSIFASTMVPGISKVFLLYWIDDRTPKLGFRDYFDCVFDAKVTHSPRFVLDVDLPSPECMFGSGQNQIGFSSSDFLHDQGRYSVEIVREIRRRALDRNEIPWWVFNDDVGDSLPAEDLRARPSGLRYLGDMDRFTSYAIQKTLFLGFPEVLSGGRDSHYNAIGWAISQKSTIINRDVFSAGGRHLADLGLPSGPVELPAVIGKCASAFGRDARISLWDMRQICGPGIDSGAAALKRFTTLIREANYLSHLHDELPPGLRRSLTRTSLAKRVLDYLVDHLDVRTLL